MTVHEGINRRPFARLRSRSRRLWGGVVVVSVFLTTTTADAGDGQRLSLPGAGGSGPYEAVKDWIAAFEAKYPEADLSISSVGSGAAQSALWGDINCAKKPVEALCSGGDDDEDGATAARVVDASDAAAPPKTIWGIGGGTFDDEAYIEHGWRDLQQLPALGGPILVTYSKDVTGNMGSKTDARLNMTFGVVSGIFNGTVTHWDDPAIAAANPNLEAGLPPHERIAILVRSDKSGMSQTFTQAISHATPEWPDEAVGKKPKWPLANITQSSTASSATTCEAVNSTTTPRHYKADGQTGIGIGLLRRPFSLGYLELGYFGGLTQFISQAHVSSPAHPESFVPASVDTLQVTMDGLAERLDPATLSSTLVTEETPPGGYPISRYVYWYIKKSHTEYESCYHAWLVYKFIEWSYTDPLAEEIALGHGWVVPPGSVVERALAKLDEMRCRPDASEMDDGVTDDVISVSSYTPAPYRPPVPVSERLVTVIASILVPLAAVAAALGVYVYVERKRKQADSVWSVTTSELHFDDPPEIIGRGTFGLVLLGEYRGTQVAVKRVIPPRVSGRYAAHRTEVMTWLFGRGDRRRRSSTGDRRRRSSTGTADRLNASFDHKDSKKDWSGQFDRAMRRDSSASWLRKSNGCWSNDSFCLTDLEESGNFDGPEDLPVSRALDVESAGSCSDANANGGMKSGQMKSGTRSGMFHSGSGVMIGNDSSSPSSKTGSTGRRWGAGRRCRGVRRGSSWSNVFGYSDEYTRLKAEFMVEMRQLSKLRHPCITTVMGAVICKKEEPMLVMEYMDHGSLYDLLHNETMIIEGELLLPILRDIAQGVRFLHSATPQVIHGDLKAQNVLVDSKFRAKVADFGLTQKKQVGATGTPFWMAPELLRGESENTSASDVYSFGIILYEVYSRKDPYEEEEYRDYKEVLKLVADPVVNKRPPVPQSCPTHVQKLMTDCLSGQPDKRPTFEDLDRQLKRLDVATVEPGEMHFSMQAKKENHARRRTDELLFEVFPQHIAEALRDGRKVEPESRETVTIFFSDIVGFTNISATLPPIKISDMLDRLYNSFDELSHRHDVFKVETIGDAYMAVTNLVKDQPDHAARIAEFSIGALEAANETLIDLDDPAKGYVNIRVGFHSGPVVANVVGSRNPRYCLFGDTVNTASRMESNSQENRIHCSERAAKLLRKQHPELRIRSRGKISVKGKGEMRTFWVNEGPKSRRKWSERSDTNSNDRRASDMSCDSNSTASVDDAEDKVKSPRVEHIPELDVVAEGEHDENKVETI